MVRVDISNGISSRLALIFKGLRLDMIVSPRNSPF